MKREGETATVGRPREFDVEVALDRALQVFWQKGYEGASLADLTKAMGINRPSLYAAFGNKEALFRKVLERYVRGPAGYVAAALAEPVAYDVVDRLLLGAVELLTDRSHPGGCLLVQGAPACAALNSPVPGELAAQRAAGELALRARLERARAEGELTPETDCADLARYFMTVLQGMAIQAVDGASRAELERVARLALQAWPCSA